MDSRTDAMPDSFAAELCFERGSLSAKSLELEQGAWANM
jgi:hypothetical protein